MELVFLLEENSAAEMLRGFLPKIVPETVALRFISFNGKSDLEGNLINKIRHYRVPYAKFIVLRDKDAGDCRAIKRNLKDLCDQSGKSGILIRIACHELESWYLADLEAVEKGLGIKNLSRNQDKPRFSDPDNHPSPSETLSEIASSYQKVGGSRLIGPHLNPHNTRSHSFSVFVKGIQSLCSL